MRQPLLGCHVRVLVNLRTTGFNAKGVGNRQLIEQGADRLENCRREDVFVLRRQRLDESDFHGCKLTGTKNCKCHSPAAIPRKR